MLGVGTFGVNRLQCTELADRARLSTLIAPERPRAMF
jgi:hypothetical protein